ncbi:helix-turn-helix domain-containing protein [Flavobacteriaceae bacterium AU392]|nr:AraC family transcriptional regulator [Flavobacteriaceae bacterium]RKM85988.1 helix-turn-helix domain-containing protein [Flavobacteriaceae bacterium AU392]
MNLISIIAIIGIVQGLFLSLSLLLPTKKNKFSLSKFFLGILIFFLCIHITDSVLTYTKEFYNFPHFFAIKDPLILLYGPLILFYALSILKKEFRLQWIHLLHLIPFVFFLYRISSLFFRSSSYKKNVLDLMYENYTEIRDIEINLLFNIHIFLYLIISLIVLIRAYLQNRKQKILPLKKKLKPVILIITAVFIVYTVNIIRFWLSFGAETILWMPLVIVLLFFVIAYRALKVGEVIAITSESKTSKEISRSMELVLALEKEIQDNMLFLNQSENLNTLAKRINTNRQYLSNAVNDVKGITFTKYLNSFKVSKAKELLKSSDYKNFTLEKIAQDSGFNSLSTFQRAFKDVEQVSPSKYRTKK